jgi:hypothetical protein
MFICRAPLSMIRYLTLFSHSWRRFSFVVLLSFFVVSCGGDAPNSRPSQWVGERSNRVAVIFVHGFFGDTLDTWKDEASSLSLIDLVRSSSTLDGKVDTFTFCCPSLLLKQFDNNTVTCP